jgi:hypothetical protein
MFSVSPSRELIETEAEHYAWLERMYDRESVADSDWDSEEYTGTWGIVESEPPLPDETERPADSEIESCLPSPEDERWWVELDAEIEAIEQDRLMAEWRLRTLDELKARADLDRCIFTDADLEASGLPVG